METQEFSLVIPVEFADGELFNSVILSKVGVKIGAFGDEFAPGAFDDVIAAGGSVPMLYGHDRSEPPMGTFGNFRMSRKNLMGDARFASTPRAQEMQSLVSEKVVRGVSIAGTLAREPKNPDDPYGAQLFTKVVDLQETSWTPWPAVAGTGIKFDDEGWRRDLEAEFHVEQKKSFWAQAVEALRETA